MENITVNLLLEKVSIAIEKNTLRSRFPGAVVRRKKLLEWNLFLTNEIRREGRCFATMCVDWRVLAVKVTTIGTKQCSLPDHIPCK